MGPKGTSGIEPEEISVRELATFIADLTGELAQLAGRAQWPLLSYFLNMARIEAEERLRTESKVIPPPA